FHERPGDAAVTRDCQIVDRFLFLFVITTGNHAVLRIAESNRKDSTGRSGGEWRIRNLPRATAVSRAQDARFSRRAGSDPCMRLTKERDVSPTSCERALVHLCGRQLCRRHTRPRPTAVSSDKYVKLLVN